VGRVQEIAVAAIRILLDEHTHGAGLIVNKPAIDRVEAERELTV
jgi:hypothetical protein